jgi:tetratricopeptide (TPR) repeat protein
MAPSPDETPSSQPSQNLASLPDVERRVLSYSATIGKEFEFSILAGAIDIEEERLAEVLEDLVHKGILREVKGGDGYSFTREETLNNAYRDISSSRVRVIHRKVAEAFERLNPDPSPEIIPQMGRHFHIGQLYDKSVLYNWHSARQAMKAFSPDVAIHYLEWVCEDLSHLPDQHRVEESDALKDLGDQFRALGDALRADEYYGKSLEKLPKEEVTLRALILLSRAEAAREMDKLGQTRQYCEEAIKLLEGSGQKKGLAMAHRSLGRAAFKEGKFDLGRRELDTALGLLDPEKDRRDVARCCIDLGNIYSDSRDPSDQDKGRDYYHKAIPILEALQDYRELFRVHNNLAITLGNDHPREALEQLREARDYAEKAKDRRSLGWALFNSVEFHLELGEEFAASQNNEEARRLLSSLNDPLAKQQITLNAGIIAYHRKAYEVGEREFKNAMKQSEDLGYPHDVAEVRMRLAMLYADWGKKEDLERELSWLDKEGKDRLVPRILSMYEEFKKRLDTAPQ